ncbi:hypothetical protein [Paeniglutamicibacter sp.]|uniref:hypothetical protein n=1 Tax=Paeniglutamicibacter sp. TaxID=1934391 RepID=UPI00398A2898
MGTFNKLINKGKQMAVKYLREQLDSGQGNRQTTPRTQGRQYDQRPAPQSRHQGHPQADRPAGPPANTAAPRNADEAVIAKYTYMLHTAPPADMERAHAEAFARLTPAQRELVQAELDGRLPDNERPRSNRPDDLARSATRAEVNRPGFMENILGGGKAAGAGRQGGRGLGGMAAGAAGGLGAGLLAGVAGAFIGSAVAGPLLEGFSGFGEELAGATEGLGEVAGGLEDSVAGLGDAASGLGESATAAGEEALGSGGGLLDGLFGAGEGFLNGGGEGGDWKF